MRKLVINVLNIDELKLLDVKFQQHFYRFRRREFFFIERRRFADVFNLRNSFGVVSSANGTVRFFHGVLEYWNYLGMGP